MVCCSGNTSVMRLVIMQTAHDERSIKKRKKGGAVMGIGPKRSVGHLSPFDRDVNVGTIPTMAQYKCK